MGEKQLKKIQKSIRITEKNEKLINTFEGENFNEKLDNALSYLQNDEAQRDLYNDIESLYKKRERLCEEIESLKSIKDHINEVFHALDELQWEFGKDIEGYKRRRVINEIINNHYKATPKSIELFMQLNDVTNRENTMKNIMQGHKRKNYVEYGEQAQKIVDELYWEFHAQELLKQNVKSAVQCR
jgi:hypothetical protein